MGAEEKRKYDDFTFFVFRHYSLIDIIAQWQLKVLRDFADALLCYKKEHEREKFMQGNVSGISRDCF